MDIGKYLTAANHVERRDILYTAAACSALASYFLSRRVRAYIRTSLLIFSIIINSAWGILISIFAGVETTYHATRAFANVCEWTIGLQLVVEGAEYLESGPSVILYNHQTMMDMVFSGRKYNPSRLGRKLTWFVV
jgi:1-acyl-sn-glycerol-3-phosphate acyltransferase